MRITHSKTFALLACLMPGVLFGAMFPGGSISTTSVLLNFERGGDVSFLGDPPGNVVCTFVNSPLWVDTPYGKGLRFHSNNAAISCEQKDMPYGAMPHVVMFMAEISSPNAHQQRYFGAIGQTSGLDLRLMLIGYTSGNFLSIDRGGTNNIYNMKIPTATWFVVAFSYPGGTAKERAYVIQKSTFQYQDTAALTYNMRPNNNLWGNWVSGNTDCRCTFKHIMISNKSWSHEEVIGRAQYLLRGSQAGIVE